MMSVDRPRVLHLSARRFWCGESNRVRVICQGLHDRQWSILLGVPADSALTEVAREKNLPVDDRFQFRGGCRPFSLGHDIRALRQLQREQAFDMVHLHTSIDTWVAALAFGFRHTAPRPLLIRTRHSDHAVRSDPVHRWLYGRVIDHVVLSSAALRVPLAGLIDSGVLSPERTTVIHSSVDIERFNPDSVSGAAVRAELDLGERFCIGLVGRISEEKGHDLLLQILPDLIRIRPNICCVFAGTGPQEETLRASVHRQGLSDYVRFAGFRSDMPAVIAALDLVVAPSRWVESSPGVVKEAMAMRKPVVAAAVGGVAEIVEDQRSGRIVPREQATALLEALHQLINDKELCRRLGDQARTRVVAQFSDVHLVDHTLQLYERLMART